MQDLSPESARVIATAGHIDHGKSSLVRALTGVDPDRLPEEKARGMTTDLGFAFLDLGNGQIAGIVDVPGHERFIRHMVAGVGGINLALVVIAANEGVMPQTREHLAILDLLDVRHGLVALTKVDLVTDEWQELVVEDVQAALAGSTLTGCPIVPCSSVTGFGLAALKDAISEALSQTPEPRDRGRPFLAIDRVFSSSGQGAVVTGTLLDGSLSIGQDVELAPLGLHSRIRGLQSHHRRLELAGPGRRVAVNLSGVRVDDVSRGMVVCLPGSVPTVSHLDLRARVVRGDRAAKRHSAGSELVLKHDMAVALHTGTTEVHGRILVLDAEMLRPGEEGWAQVRCETPLALLPGARCILRVPSPARTIAGGSVVAVNPPRHRRFSSDVVTQLNRLASATSEERMIELVDSRPLKLHDLASKANLPEQEVVVAIANLNKVGRVMALQIDQPRARAEGGVQGMLPSPRAQGADRSRYWTTHRWLACVTDSALAALRAYHLAHPLRRGMPSEALREAARIEPGVWQELLPLWQASLQLVAADGLLRDPVHVVRLSSEQRQLADAWLDQLRGSPRLPPTSTDLQPLDPGILQALIDLGEAERLADGIYVSGTAYAEMRDETLELIDRRGCVTVAIVRDALQTSRKISLALLEHLDSLHLTRRVGDERMRGSTAPG
jgi:selenocysteine-specific elongation factor